MKKQYQVVYYNGWGNPVTLCIGTLDECKAYADRHDYCTQSGYDMIIEDYK